MAKEKKEPPLPDALRALPPLSLEEAAWVVGITPEALQRFLTAADALSNDKVTLPALARAGFELLSQREAQLEMLRLQLSNDIVHVAEEEAEAAATPKGKRPAPAKSRSRGKGRKGK